MLYQEEFDKNYQTIDKQLKELTISMEALDRNYQDLLNHLSMTSEQLKSFMENPANFTPEAWEELQQEKEKMEQMLKLQFSCIAKPQEVKKKYSERGSIQQNWLFVR